MPLLWTEVHLWGPRQTNPSTLLKYPRERVFQFIRTMHISTSHEDMDKTKLDGQSKYLSKCLKFLNNATNIKSLDLYVRLYNVDNHPPEFRTKLEVINGSIFRILRLAANIELDEFGYHPDNEMAVSPDVLSIIERKLTKMSISHRDCGKWVKRLRNQEKLTSIEFYASEIEYTMDPDGYDRIFWTSIAQLENCKEVLVSDLPIPLDWNIRFRNLTHLHLFFTFRWELPPFDCVATFMTVFQYMPRLEHLHLSSLHDPGYQLAAEALEISNVACKDLKILNLSGYYPRKLLVTIGSQCPKLTTCSVGIHDLNDEDLRALSRCQSLVSLSLCVPNQKVTNGLSYLTNLPQLAKLDMHYSFGRCIDAQLLYDLARHCPRLNIIRTSDVNSIRRESDPRPFETEDIAELFVAGAELRAYFEPQYKEPSPWDTPRQQMERLKEYFIHIDDLRRDKSLF